MAGRKAQFDDLVALPSVRTRGVAAAERSRPVGGVVKRALDVAVSSSALLLLLPLLALLAVAVRLSSPGPAMYGQRRRGFRNEEFTCWKFRSMVPDSNARLTAYLEASPEAAREWRETRKLRNDPRVTRVGAFLRNTSLDELPQLWNVLCGDMSLVGPRPIVDAEITRYGGKFRYYAASRPGLTGLWQISGRSDTSYQARVDFDSYYVANWSISRDLMILTKTVPAVLSRRGSC